VPIGARGGGAGLVGGAVATHGGVVCSLERLRRVRELEPGLWRILPEAGVSTRHVQRLARENGLFFAPDPGAAEQSQIGGNVATNAGGPHALKYGGTGAWVAGLEAVLAPGELVQPGGWAGRDVAGYGLKSLRLGSDGPLGGLPAAALRLLPPAQAAGPRPADEHALCRWRDGITGVVTAERGMKGSEDVVFPVECLREGLERFEQIAESHGLRSCAWGHGGEGNVHATVLVDPASET